jgi:hypothetical protein
LDIEDIDGYPNKCPVNQFDLLPNFDGSPLSVVEHVVEYSRCIRILGAQHEDVCLQLFVLSLGSEQRNWIKDSYKPRGIYSLMIRIREFLKHWGPQAQSLEDTIQDLEDAFLREGFELHLIEALREMLLPEFAEKTVERQEVDKSNEESFECLNQSREEDFEFCEQLMKLSPISIFWLSFFNEEKKRLMPSSMIMRKGLPQTYPRKWPLHILE